MKFLNVLIFMFMASLVHAHSPDLSNLMIYEQNGKCFLLIKSSLTAFAGEVDFHFKKNAYKTPEEFEQLVLNFSREIVLSSSIEIQLSFRVLRLNLDMKQPYSPN